MSTCEERKLWIYQAKKLISLCLLILGECDYSRQGGQDFIALTSLAMRFGVILIDQKGWKCINENNQQDADIAVKDIVLFMASKKSDLYPCIRRYISRLDAPFYSLAISSGRADDKFLITASAITLALRPFHFVNFDTHDDGFIDVKYAAEQYWIYLLTIPWFAQRLPAVLFSALKHKSVLSPCFKMLLVRLRK